MSLKNIRPYIQRDNGLGLGFIENERPPLYPPAEMNGSKEGDERLLLN